MHTRALQVTNRYLAVGNPKKVTYFIMVMMIVIVVVFILMIIVFLSAIIRITASLMPQRFAVSTCASLSTTALTLFAIIRGHSLLLLSTVVVIVSRVVIISVFLVADAVCHRVVATVVVVTIICGFGHGSCKRTIICC